MILFYLYFFTLINGEQIIKNINFPSCKTCKFFTPSNKFSFDSKYHNCEKFGEKNIFTDEIEYKSASLCRSDEKLCGESGKYFEKEPYLRFKIAKHYTGSMLPNFLSLILLCLTLILITLKK